MPDFLWYLNITATVLGYIFMILILLVFSYYFTWFVANYRYKQKRKRRQDREWDHLRNAWILDMRNDERRTIDEVRTNTNILDLTVEQIYDYQKEIDRDNA